MSHDQHHDENVARGSGVTGPNPSGGESRHLTFGERAVGLSFNPSNDPKVQKVKELYAQIIDICDEIRKEEPTYTQHEVPSERANMFTVAIREAQGAQMWAVKAITWKN